MCVTAEWLETPVLSFELTPSQITGSGQFYVEWQRITGTGWMNYAEEARAQVEARFLRPVNGDVDEARRTLLDDIGDVLSAMVRDGAGDGEYAVEDAGRGITVEQPKGASYLLGLLRVTVNFEAQL